MNEGRAETDGFTIVEVLIVLAITAVMFLGAVLLISGKQNQTEFDQAIHEVQTEIQQTIGDVSNGYFPNANNFTCTAGASGPLIAAGTGSGQGTNSGCTFIGKVIQFGVSGTNPEQYAVYSVAGLQQDSSGNDVTTLSAAVPTVIAPSTANPSVPNDSILTALENGLTTYQAKTISNGSKIGAVAFISSLAPTSITQPGAQHVNLIPIAGSTLGMNGITAANTINSALQGSPTMNPSGGAQICFVSATTNQSGLITIGGNDSTLSVALSIKGDQTC
jgi:prepilin-type N-terminal cleavage/methylation domain-containing protein